LLLDRHVGADRLQDPAPPEGQQVCSRDAADPDWARLCTWMEDYCGGEGMQNILAGEFEHGGHMVRGVAAAVDLKADQNVLCVPSKCWLKIGTESERVRQMTNRQDCGELERFAIHVAEENRKGEASVWAPYLQMLPTEAVYRNFHPAYLEGKLDLGGWGEYWNPWSGALKKCYKSYVEKAGDSAVTFAQAYEALVQVNTRRYGDVDMVPIGDLLNTVPSAQLNVAPKYKDETSKDFCLVAKWDLSAGTELTVDYGADHHSAMMMHSLYGFAFAPEHHNESLHGHPQFDGPVDVCSGSLRTLTVDVDTDPVVRNYWNFAQVHCKGEPTGSPSAVPSAASPAPTRASGTEPTSSRATWMAGAAAALVAISLLMACAYECGRRAGVASVAEKEEKQVTAGGKRADANAKKEVKKKKI